MQNVNTTNNITSHRIAKYMYKVKYQTTILLLISCFRNIHELKAHILEINRRLKQTSKKRDETNALWHYIMCY